MGRTALTRVLGSLVLGASLLGSAASLAGGAASAATPQSAPAGAHPADIIMPYGIIIYDGAGHGGGHRNGIILPWDHRL
jgi:hypothetical protein